MKVLALLCLFLCSFTTQLNAKVPRQKIYLTGATLPNTPKSLAVDQLEKSFDIKELKLHDPYNKNLLTSFYGFSLEEFLNKYARKSVTKISVKAIDGYQVTMSKETIKAEKLFLSFKDQDDYFAVDRMGPVRIIGPFNGVIPKDTLLKIGVNWVWQVRDVEFIE